jgi:hypothetical protein
MIWVTWHTPSLPAKDVVRSEKRLPSSAFSRPSKQLGNTGWLFGLVDCWDVAASQQSTHFRSTGKVPFCPCCQEEYLSSETLLAAAVRAKLMPILRA